MEMDRKPQGRLGDEQINREIQLPSSASQLNVKHQQIINQHLPIGIVETSLAGQYLDVNEEFCRMLGYEREELLQRGIKDVTHEEDYHVDIKLLGQLAAGEIPYYHIEKRFVRKDSQVIWADLTRSPARDASGNIPYIVGIVVDITERHRAEDAILQGDDADRPRLHAQFHRAP